VDHVVLFVGGGFAVYRVGGVWGLVWLSVVVYLGCWGICCGVCVVWHCVEYCIVDFWLCVVGYLWGVADD